MNDIVLTKNKYYYFNGIKHRPKYAASEFNSEILSPADKCASSNQLGAAYKNDIPENAIVRVLDFEYLPVIGPYYVWIKFLGKYGMFWSCHYMSELNKDFTNINLDTVASSRVW